METHIVSLMVGITILLTETKQKQCGLNDFLYVPNDSNYLSTISCALRTLYPSFSRDKFLVILDATNDMFSQLFSRSLENEIRIPLLIEDVQFDTIYSQYKLCSTKHDKLLQATTVLILVHDKLVMAQLLVQAKKCSYWNSRTKLIVMIIGYLSEDYLKDMLQYCWKLKVLNIIVVYIEQLQEYRNIVSVTTYNPFSRIFHKYMVCHCVWYGCQRHQEVLDLFTDKLQNLHGYVLKACAYQLEPYLKGTISSTGNSVRGLDWYFHMSLSKHLNFTYKFTSLEYDYVGFRLSNGTWTAAFGDILSEKVDIILNRVRFTRERLEVMDFSMGTYISSINIMVPKAGFIPKWKALVLPFESYVWALIVLSLVVLELVWRIFIKIHGPRERLVSRTNPFLYILSIILKISVSYKPLYGSTRTMFFICAIFFLVLSSIYETSLVGYLIQNKRYPDINTLKEVAESDLEVQSFIFHRDLLKLSSNPYLRKMMSRHHLSNNMTDMLDSVGVLGTSACLYHYIILEYNANSKFITPSGEKSVHIIDEPVVAYFGGYVLTKNSPFLPKVEQHAQRLFESGLDAEWKKYLNHEVKLKSKSIHTTTNDRDVVLTYTHTKSIFVLWLIGVAVGTICYFVEEIYSWLTLKELFSV